MDLSEIKNRLSAMQSKQGNNSGEKKNIYFKPSVGKESVRVVPSKFNKATPFTELYIHYGIGNKVMISPTNWGEKDPIVEFAKQLRKTNDKDNWRLAKKLDPKLRIFAPVIVRGKESEGVKLWQFGKETYMDFLNLADNEDVGDFTDIVEGRDITLTTVGPEVTGTAYNKTNIMPRTKQTTLSDDKNLVKSLLENQPNPMETFKKYSYDEMKQALQDWLNPEEAEEEEEMPLPTKSAPVEEPASDLPWDNEEPKKTSKKYDIKTPTKPVSKADKFDALFDDEDEDA
jgi:hypothetical protein